MAQANVRVKRLKRKGPKLFGPYPDLAFLAAFVGVVLNLMEAPALIAYIGGLGTCWFVLSTALDRKKRGE